MPLAMYGSFVFSVVVLITNAYFLLGGLPLLVLKHDVPLDAKFIRSFFNVYYRVAFWSALFAAISYAIWGRIAFALGTLAVAAVAIILRVKLLPLMQEISTHIEANNTGAIQRFRKLHAMALLVILAQLVFLVWGLIQLSRAL